MGADDQAVELGQDRLSGRAARQAALVVLERRGDLSQVFVRPAEIHECECVAGPILVFEQEQPEVTLELAPIHGGVLIA